MPRYIDADTLYQKINDWRKQIKATYGEYDDFVECLGEVLTMIGSEPNADVVPVIRCKDCIYYDEDDLSEGKKKCFCYLHLEFRAMEYFCASAERREI